MIYPVKMLNEAKGKKAIAIPSNNMAMEVLKPFIIGKDLFLFTKGDPVKKAGSTAWKKALNRAGIKNFRWHDLRHTWASWHRLNGTPLDVLQELRGWSAPKNSTSLCTF